MGSPQSTRVVRGIGHALIFIILFLRIYIPEARPNLETVLPNSSASEHGRFFSDAFQAHLTNLITAIVPPEVALV